MAKQYSESLTRYQLPQFDAKWGALRRGIEKESLRVSPAGRISQASHPLALGSALTNPVITTDFSEALLEFITPVYSDIDECLQKLENIHRFTLQNLDNDEMLWVNSMPCPCGSDDDIPIAQYGRSNIGKLKTLYRHGLSHRYGKLMQAIAGIHYNFSMPEAFWLPYQQLSGHHGSLKDFISERYLHLIRNFHRNSWLLIYLFGASPAACKCFVRGREHGLKELDENSLYLPYATCLRMGNLGYRSEAQKSLFVCYNELDSYIDCLDKAMHTSYSDYEKIGRKKNGEYLQINTNLLQLANEFYSTIRPKRIGRNGERPLRALANHGIEYIEVRLLDLNPYLPLGIDAEQMRFLDTFLLHCLLSESPHCDEREFFAVSKNIAGVVERGRDPGLVLSLDGTDKPMREWADALLTDLEHSAAILDHVRGAGHHQSSLGRQAEKLKHPDLTPSGKILKEMQDNHLSFFEFSMQQSRLHSRYLRDNGLDSKIIEEFRATSASSLRDQQEIEEADTMPFSQFLDNWNAS